MKDEYESRRIAIKISPQPFAVLSGFPLDIPMKGLYNIRKRGEAAINGGASAVSMVERKGEKPITRRATESYQGITLTPIGFHDTNPFARRALQKSAPRSAELPKPTQISGAGHSPNASR